MNFVKPYKYFLVLAVLFSFGCGDVRGPYYDSNGQPEADPSLNESSIFPHSDGWKDYSAHGKFVVDNGNTQCANSCHGEDLEGGSARGCKTCHSVYPHPSADTWGGIMGHGKFVRDSNPTDCATKCHGADFSGGYNPKGNKSCVKCHSSYPVNHMADKWAILDHGKFVLANGDYKECSTMCHRQDAPEELKVKTCFDCHANYPDSHVDGWSHPENHGVAYLNDNNSCRSACHGKDLNGGMTGVSCRNCHKSYPHDSDDWETAHGKNVLTADDKFDQDGFDKDCAVCHGKTEKLNQLNPSITPLTTATGVDRCYKCHSNYPHVGYYGWSSWESKFYMDYKDETWAPNGHMTYFLSNFGYTGLSTSDKITRLKSLSNGCYSDLGGCHKNSRHGPTGFSKTGFCGSVCHQ